MKKLFSNKLASDLIWNYGGIVVLSIGGIAFSLIIANFYDAAVLGVFNQVYTYYLLLSQVSVFGVHMAITKYIPPHTDDYLQCKIIVHSALRLVLIISLVTSAIVSGILLVLGGIYSSEVIYGLWLIIPALILFSLNKVLLAFFNGISAMKPFAVFQSLRNILIALTLYVMAVLRTPSHFLVLCFLIAEGVLFIASTIFLMRNKRLDFSTKSDPIWIRELFSFGYKILPSNFLLEIKADIICLGLLLHNNTLLGYYSFASLFIDGYFQLFIVVRRIINPMLAKDHAQSNFKQLYSNLKSKINKFFPALAFVTCALLIAGYYVLCQFMKPGYERAILPMLIMAFSISLNSRSIVLGNLLNQTGFPKDESLVNLFAALVSFSLNLALIPVLGIYGSAIAMAMQYTAFSIALKYKAKKRLAV